MTSLRQQHGSLVIIAIILLVIGSLLSLTITSVLIGNIKGGSEQTTADQALFLAEAGLDTGIRGWALDTANYTGEGPLTLDNGSFTITTSDFDSNGAALPADQKRIISIGTTNSAFGPISRTLDVIASVSAQSLLNEPFADINNWLSTGVTDDSFCPTLGGGALIQQSDGSVTHEATDDAPGSTGGSFMAQVVGGKSGERLAGYNEYTFGSAIPSNTPVSLDFWYQKYRGKPSADILNMAVDLVATDGALFRLWSECQPRTLSWQAATTIDWQVPAGVTIDRIRLAYDIQNQVTTAGGPKVGASVSFDEISMTSVAGIIW